MRTNYLGVFGKVSAVFLGASLITGCGDAMSGGEAGPQERAFSLEGEEAPVDVVAAESFAPITEKSATLLSNVSDLRGLVFSADGKLYASGHVGSATTVDRTLAVLRFNADGSPDASFGSGGLVTHNLVERVVDDIGLVVNDGNEESFGILELADGSLVVEANVRDANGLGTDVVLVKLTATGELVESFGEGGVLRLDFGWTPADDASWPVAGAAPVDNSWDIALDTSSGVEKVVVFAHGPAAPGLLTTATPAVQRVDNDRYISRVLASDGSRDPEFRGGALYTLQSGATFSDGGRRGFVEADGSIVSAGYTNFGESFGNHVLAIRLLPDGTPDPAFKAGIAQPGVIRANPFIEDGGVAECYAIGKQSNGRYVSTGYGRATAAGVASSLGWATTDAVDLVSVGFTGDGVDLSYGVEGTLAVQSEPFALGNTEDRGRDLVVLADDRVVHVGRFGPNPGIFVTTPEGQLDTGSGVEGRFTYPALTAPTAHFFTAELSPDGKTIVATTSNHADGVLLVALSVGE
jgi:uncharacterized delta-60 repeat protein